jgi:predicted cupin superfamily sugar epimerase
MNQSVANIVERYALQPHPEGGYFREVYRSSHIVEHPAIPTELGSRRRCGSLIYFLLGREDFSAFHRVRWTDEIWHLYAGGPIELHLIDEAGRYSEITVHSDLTLGAPTAVVPGGCWQAARLAPECEWAFGGCTVAPGFEFADFEMPLRDTLLQEFPRHADIIRALTRG